MKKRLLTLVLTIALLTAFVITTHADGSGVSEFDPNGTYKAFLGIQMDNWIFRNGWADKTFGENGTDWEKYDDNYFYNLFHIDSNGIKPGVFHDVEIKGNGKYKVSLTDWDFEDAGGFNQLYISTNIPLEGNILTFTDVHIYLGGYRHTFDEAYVSGVDDNDKKDYYEVFAINIWQSALQGLFFDEIPQNGEIAIEFTVSGFAYDKEEEETPSEEEPAPATSEEEPASEEETPSEEEPPSVPADVSSGGSNDESNLPGWLIPVIIAVVAISVICIVALNMKKKK